MKLLILSAIMMLLLSLQRCSSVPEVDINNYTVGHFREAITVEKSEFDKETKIQSIYLRDSTFTSSVEQTYVWALISEVSEEDTRRYIYIDITYRGGDMRFYGNAQLPGGTELNEQVVRRKVLSCTSLNQCRYNEIIAIDISDDVFYTAVKNGLRMRINSRYDQHKWVSELPQNLFTAQRIEENKVAQNL